jgi:hypothetical protein
MSSLPFGCGWSRDSLVAATILAMVLVVIAFRLWVESGLLDRLAFGSYLVVVIAFRLWVESGQRINSMPDEFRP